MNNRILHDLFSDLNIFDIDQVHTEPKLQFNQNIWPGAFFLNGKEAVFKGKQMVWWVPYLALKKKKEKSLTPEFSCSAFQCSDCFKT